MAKWLKLYAIYITLCLKKPDCNDSQRLLIIFGRERPYSILS